MNGTGYPDNLWADHLSLESKLVAVADFYRALVEDRPYRLGMSHLEAIAILRDAPVDARCVDALDTAWRKSAAGQRAMAEEAFAAKAGVEAACESYSSLVATNATA